MKLFTILSARQVLNSLSETEGINPRLAYRMAKFISKTEADSGFYSEQVRALLKKYNASEDNGIVNIAKEDLSDFNDEVKKIQDIEVEDPGVRFSLAELANDIRLSMKQILPLMDFIDED